MWDGNYTLCLTHRRALQCTWCPHAETRLSLSVLFTAIGWEKRGSSLRAQLLANGAPPIHPTHATAAWVSVREHRNCANPGEEWRTPTRDSEIKEIDLLGLNLMNPTSREYQSIVMLNAGLTISQLLCAFKDIIKLINENAKTWSTCKRQNIRYLLRTFFPHSFLPCLFL